MLNLDQHPVWVVFAAFAVAAILVWGAGTRLSRYLDAIATRTGIGAGFLGLLVLGGITSLPEAATVASASLAGNASLAVNNLLGSASANIVLLAIADAILGRRALASVVGDPTPLLQGVLGVILLAVVVAAITVGDVAVAGVGLWSAALVVLFLFSAWLTSKYEHRRTWSVVSTDEGLDSAVLDVIAPVEAGDKGGSVRSYVVRSAITAVVILAGGYVLAESGDAIARQTGIGSGLVGLVLVGFATSLPEISTIYEAVRLERYKLVLGNIFGTNIFNVVLIFLADIFYAGPPIFNATGLFEAVATLLAIVLTSIYLVGLLERRDRTFFRMGYASLAVIIVYVAGIVLLYEVAQRSGA